MVEISFGLDDSEGDRVIMGAANEGFVRRWRTKEVSGEREEELKGLRERGFERRKCSLREMECGMGEVEEELASDINRTC